MSLATRCTACGTVFRVVQDQLRVSGGWVRCGRCGEVFNAVESLVELEAEAPAEAPLPSIHGSRVMQDLARVAGAPLPAEPPASAAAVPEAEGRPANEAMAAGTGPDDALAAAAVQAPAAEEAAPPAPEALEEAVGAEAAIVAEPPLESSAGWEPSKPRRIRSGRSAAGRTAGKRAPSGPTPAFVRQAERAARWRQPRVRAGLAVLGSLAAMVLFAQLTWTYHDVMAARWPVLLPAIERLCTVGGCVVEPPRRIDSLTVESSGLVRAGGAGAYRLSLVLRNRDRMALRLPYVDLALTDAQGRTIARRVLEPAQLGASQPSLAAGAELPLAVSLRALDAGVVGYTIEIFYP